MAAHDHHSSAPAETLRGNEWRSISVLVPYLWDFRWRVLAAHGFSSTPNGAPRGRKKRAKR